MSVEAIAWVCALFAALAVLALGRADRVLAIWAATALLWIFRSPMNFGAFTLPGWSQLFGKPPYLHDATVAMGMAMVQPQQDSIPRQPISLPRMLMTIRMAISSGG